MRYDKETMRLIKRHCQLIDEITINFKNYDSKNLFALQREYDKVKEELKERGINL